MQLDPFVGTGLQVPRSVRHGCALAADLANFAVAEISIADRARRGRRGGLRLLRAVLEHSLLHIFQKSRACTHRRAREPADRLHESVDLVIVRGLGKSLELAEKFLQPRRARAG